MKRFEARADILGRRPVPNHPRLEDGFLPTPIARRVAREGLRGGTVRIIRDADANPDEVFAVVSRLAVPFWETLTNRDKENIVTAALHALRDDHTPHVKNPTFLIWERDPHGIVWPGSVTRAASVTLQHYYETIHRGDGASVISLNDSNSKPT